MSQACNESRAASLSQSESLLLDLIRIGAAITVAVGHLTQPLFSTGWRNLIFLAELAVVIFFVLSGFVIRHATLKRPSTLGRYLDDRASRIYSVALPALLFTLAVDTISHKVNPGFYHFWASSFTHPTLRVIENLIFVAQLWTLDISPLSNSPFWSLNYEVGYYLLYGCMFYFSGYVRWIAIAATAIVLGPKILVLAPIWILGAYAHDLYFRWDAEHSLSSRVNLLLVCTFAIFLCGVLLMAASSSVRSMVLHSGTRISSLHLNLKLGRSEGFITYFVAALIFVPLLLKALLVARFIVISQESIVVRCLRIIAEGTFPLYLLHFPIYVLVASCVPYDHANAFQKLSMLFLAVLVGVMAGYPANILKDRIRKITRRLISKENYILPTQDHGRT